MRVVVGTSSTVVFVCGSFMALLCSLLESGRCMACTLEAALKTPPAGQRRTAVLDELRDELAGRAWTSAWAVMVKEKAVVKPLDLSTAIARFEAFVRPLLTSLKDGKLLPRTWKAGGPWVRRTDA